MKENNIKNIKAIILGLVFVFGTNLAIGAWSDPFCGPPDCSPAVPINATTDSQAKPGPLLIGDGSLISTKGYYFSAIKGLSYFDGVIANRFYLEDGNLNKTGKFLMSNANGVATWQDYTSKVTSTSIITANFSILVSRKSTRSLTIPSTYQYCAISQLGPDSVNSNNSSSQCYVNQNTDNTWTLYGARADDPDFICKAQCFYSPEITSVVKP